MSRLPVSEDDEFSVIGACMWGPAYRPEILKILRPEHFAFEMYREMFVSVLRILENIDPSKEIRPADIAGDMNLRGVKQPLGDALVDGTLFRAFADAGRDGVGFAVRIRKLWARREFLVTCDAMGGGLSAGGHLTTEEAGAMFAAMYERIQPKSSYSPIPEFHDDWGTRISSLDPTVGERRGDGVFLIAKQHRTLISASPGSGKSLMCVALAVEVAAQGGKVRYFDFESDLETAKERFQHHRRMANLHTFVNYSSPDDYLDLAQRNLLVTEMADPTKRPALVIVDGFDGLLANHGRSANKAEDIAFIMKTFFKPFEHPDTAVIIIDHGTKDDLRMARSGTPGGSVKKIGLVDSVFGLSKCPDAPLRKGKQGFATINVTKDRKSKYEMHCQVEDNVPVWGAFSVDSDHDGSWDHQFLSYTDYKNTLNYLPSRR